MASSPHIILFPFMAKGHTIPLLHLARLLHDRHVSVTVITTPTNLPFIARSLVSLSSISLISLPFPAHIQGIPDGVESTDTLPSMSLFTTFAKATKLMQPSFEQTIGNLPRVTCIISDAFLGWTLDVATKFGFPRIVFHGMNSYSQTILHEVSINRLLSGPELDDDPVTVTSFPWIKLTRNDFHEPFNMREPHGPDFDFVMELVSYSVKSYGLITNSFYELEPLYADYWNREFKPKAWCVGPLCLAQPIEAQYKSHEKPMWLAWLDRRLELRQFVLYVAFGSQGEITCQQLTEIAIGLEDSKVNFLWVIRKGASDIPLGFEERVKERGIVVREWIDQRVVLEHEAIQGYLSQCGWNSLSESICAKVPVLAWPMMADQHLNAKMAIEEIKVGIRVETIDGKVKGLVNRDELKRSIKELMEGEMGKSARAKAKEHGESAKKAMEKGGSSWNTLNQLIDEVYTLRSGC